LEKLGGGAFGSVWKAKKILDDHVYAIKKIFLEVRCFSKMLFVITNNEVYRYLFIESCCGFGDSARRRLDGGLAAATNFTVA